VPGYSQIVVAQAGELVAISGQVALDRDGHLVGRGDFAAQADQTFRNLSKYTLRYYEQVGVVPRVGRDPSSGHRRYRDEHISWLQFLRDLRSTGMPIRDVRAYVKLIERGDASSRQEDGFAR
jgi:DNA-binding transcriptional MerR regulator